MKTPAWINALFPRRFPRPIRPVQRVRPQLEILEDRLAPSATLWTDKQDYAPQSIATIFGAGYLAGETVHLEVVHLDAIYQNQYQPWDITDGDATPASTDMNGVWHMPDLDGAVDGNIQTTWQVGDIPGSTLQVTGTGLTSGETATATFTDGTTTVTSLTVGAQSGSVTYGTAGSVTYSVTVTTSQGGGGFRPSVALTVSGLPSGVSGVFTTTPLPASGGSTTLTLTTTSTAFAGAYTFTVTASATNSVSVSTPQLTIQKRAITVTAATNTKTYNGTTSAGATPTITAGSLANSDTASFAETYDNRNAGTGKTLTPSGSVNDGNSGNNYTVTFVNNTTGVINKAALTIAATTNTKTYDGNTSAAATPSVSGLQGSDTVTGLAEAYDNKNAGTGKTLSVTAFTVNDGNSGNNYAVATVDDTSGVINQASLTITATTNTKTYDGTTSAAATPMVSSLQGSDTATGLVEAYDNKNAGTGKTLSVTAYTVNDGNSGNNYAVTTVDDTSGVINQASLTITATTNTKVYDGTTSAAATPTVSGLKGTDTVTGLVEAYDTPSVGTGKTLSVTGFTINDGNSGNNYMVTLEDNPTGVINPGPAAMLKFIQQPIFGLAGKVLAPAFIVQLVDAFGNAVQQANVAVKIKISSGKFKGTQTVKTNANGQAIFAKVSVAKSGVYTFTAVSGGLTQAVSGPVTIIGKPPPAPALQRKFWR